jgi:hypothetical protein
MISRYPELRQLIKQAGMSWADLSAATGITLFDIHLKMFGIKRWGLTDVVRICSFFRCTDAERLFVQKHSKTTTLESQGKFGNK